MRLSPSGYSSPTRSAPIRRPGHRGQPVTQRLGVVSENHAGLDEVSLNHLIGDVATPGRVHPAQPPTSGRSTRHQQPLASRRSRSSASLATGRSPLHKAMYTLHCSFRTAASSRPPPDPRSPERPGLRLPNFNDQSSGQDSHLLVNETVRRNAAPALRAGLPSASPRLVRGPRR